MCFALEIISSKAFRFFVDKCGYAAITNAIAIEMKGGQLVVPNECFCVTGVQDPLKDGELKRAADWPGCNDRRNVVLAGVTPPRLEIMKRRSLMIIVIPTIGTRGDVQPYNALSLGLQKAGHDLTHLRHP
jgi:hypothetical protein